MDAVTKFNSSCVIILGFLNPGAGAYLVGLVVGRTGSVASSKMIDSSNTGGTFCTFVIPIVVLLCLIFSKISFPLSTLSTSALIVGCHIAVCLRLTLLV